MPEVTKLLNDTTGIKTQICPMSKSLPFSPWGSLHFSECQFLQNKDQTTYSADLPTGSPRRCLAHSGCPLDIV